LGITKFDILLPDKKQGALAEEEIKEEKEKQSEEDKQKEAENEEKMKQAQAAQRERFRLTETGLKLLDLMVPEAAWTSISKTTDMFPYYQPLYQFPDGFNLLAPENPIQIIIVLLRILEDFFRGCRNITFNLPTELAQKNADSFSEAMTEWMSYREILFEKNYSTDLKDYVNNLYSKADFGHTALGKKLIFNLLWQTKHYFLPFFKVEQLSFEKPTHEVTLKQLSTRVTFLRDIFSVLAEKVDAAFSSRAPIPEIPNAWEKYKFDIENVVSHRLDALLGAKKNSPVAVNASVIKYTAAVLAVLDWWINDETSPAHDAPNFRLFRISSEDGRPVFSAEMRTDQDDLFKANLKKLAEQAQGTQTQQTQQPEAVSQPDTQESAQGAAQTTASAPDAQNAESPQAQETAPQEQQGTQAQEVAPLEDAAQGEDADKDAFVVADAELAGE
jgi:hypothetical protein